MTPGTDGFVDPVIDPRGEVLSGNIDIGYLRRYTNAPWLVIRNPGAADDGLFWRDDSDTPQIIDSKTGKPVAHDTKSANAALKGEIKLPDGGVAVPVFVLMAEAYLDDAYDPDAIADTVGVGADRIRQLAVDLWAAFAREVVINQPWTDWKDERHEKMIGRPVSMHAMRGISAHSNGFRHAGRCMCCNLSWDQSRHLGVFASSHPTQNHRKCILNQPDVQIRWPQVPGDGRRTAWICVGARRSSHLPRRPPHNGLTRV